MLIYTHTREINHTGTPLYRKTEGNAHIHTHKDNEHTHAHTYPNTDSWAERHYGFGCQWRASSMNCSDQRNASLISPICAWPYIYITFQHSLSEGSRNLGQHWGKCKGGQADQQESRTEWRIGWFSRRSWVQLFSKRTAWQIWVSHVFKQKVLFKGLTCPDIRVRDEEKWKYLWGNATQPFITYLPAPSPKATLNPPRIHHLNNWLVTESNRSPPKKASEVRQTL